MSQDVWSTIDPLTTSGTQLATLLNNFKNAVMSGMSGTSRPTQTTAGGGWIDITNAGSPNFYWAYKVYTGSVDVEVFRINLATGLASISGTDSTFEISKTSADAVGPLLEFIKQRVASSGQDLIGDEIGEIRFTGRASDASDPIVATIRVVASDNMTVSASGAYIVFETTVAGAAAAAEHMRLMNGKLGIGTQAPDSMVHAVGATGIKSAYTADSANPAKLTLEKGRVAGTGATQNADSIGEIDFNTTDDATAKSTSAKIVASAIEAHTAAAQGTKLVVSTATTGAATATSKIEIGDKVETVVTLKQNSVELVAQTVATTATINQLSATKAIVEFSGATPTSIRGINSGHASKVVLLHNGSSADITLEHENGGAVAADQLKLPEGEAIIIPPQSSIEMFYSTVDSRWKLKSGSATGEDAVAIITEYNFRGGTFLAPTGVENVLVTSRRYRGALANYGFIDSYGRLFATGLNTSGNLGVGDVTPRSSPVAVLGGLFFSKAYIGDGSTEVSSYGLTTTGVLYAWGGNAFGGHLGLGDTTPRSSPVAVLGGLFFAKLSTPVATMQNVAALTPNGTAYMWGNNAHGNLGLGDVTYRSSPVAVLGGLKFSSISLTSSSTLGLTTTGEAYGWGNNTRGLLGLGDNTSRSSPVAVLGGLTFGKLFLANGSSYGITTDGVLYAWGNNMNGTDGNGQLGVGDTVSRSSPVAVLGGLVVSDVQAVQTGLSVTALNTDGAAYAWGSNFAGCLGVGDEVHRSSPVAVLGGLTFKKIKSGNNAFFGITTSGDLYAWGYNGQGQLGVGDTTNRSSPVLVLGGLKWIDVDELSYSSTSMRGLASDGKLYSWGGNASGELGLGDVVSRSSPVVVLGPSLPAVSDVVKSFVLPVTPGESYTITLNEYHARFGSEVVGEMVDLITVQYG